MIGPSAGSSHPRTGAAMARAFRKALINTNQRIPSHRNALDTESFKIISAQNTSKHQMPCVKGLSCFPSPTNLFTNGLQSCIVRNTSKVKGSLYGSHYQVKVVWPNMVQSIRLQGNLMQQKCQHWFLVWTCTCSCL